MFRKITPARVLQPGLDLPRWFIDDLLAIDKNFHFVFHEWRVQWDNVMNYYEGSEEDPRCSIHEFAGKECWGLPLADSKGDPIPENKWHVWCHRSDYGYSHVINVDSRDPLHLRKVVDTVHLEAILRDKGRRAYIEAKQESQKSEQRSVFAEATEKFNYMEKENRKLTKEAYENFERAGGKLDSKYVKPTNPTRESIYSYPGQKNRSTKHIPITDKEAGLTTWEDLE